MNISALGLDYAFIDLGWYWRALFLPDRRRLAAKVRTMINYRIGTYVQFTPPAPSSDYSGIVRQFNEIA